jgi:hypothetical protein
MGENFRRRLEPIIEKFTKKGVRDGIKLLRKAGSTDPLAEQQKWIHQHVDNPAEMLTKINESDMEDTPLNSEHEVESDGSDIEVVVSDDESEDIGDGNESDLDDFIALSSSDDTEDNVSDDGEHSYEGSNEAGNEEESCEEDSKDNE